MSYYRNDLNRHKAADTIKWIVAFVLITAIIGVVVCLALQVAGVYDFLKQDNTSADKNAEALPKDDNVKFEIENSEFSTYCIEGIQGVSLDFATTAAEVDPYSKTLTATVQPVDAPDKNVDWSIAWTSFDEMPSDDVSEYLSVTPTSDGALTATVKCLKAFSGKSIDVKVTTRLGGFSAVCKVTYTGHPESLSITMTGATKKTDSGWGLDIYEFESTKTYDFALSVDNKFHSVGAAVAYEIESVTGYGDMVFDFKSNPSASPVEEEGKLVPFPDSDGYYVLYASRAGLYAYKKIAIQNGKLHIEAGISPGAVDNDISGSRYSTHLKFKRYKDSTKLPYVAIKIKEKNSGVTYTVNVRVISSVTGVNVSSPSIDF